MRHFILNFPAQFLKKGCTHDRVADTCGPFVRDPGKIFPAGMKKFWLTLKKRDLPYMDILTKLESMRVSSTRLMTILRKLRSLSKMIDPPDSVYFSIQQPGEFFHVLPFAP